MRKKITKTKLERIDGDTLREVSTHSGKEVSREWNRRFYQINLLLDNITVNHEFRINSGAGSEFILEKFGMNDEERKNHADSHNSFKKIKPDPQIVRRISGKVCRRAPDYNRRIHVLSEMDDGTYQYSEPFKSIRVDIFNSAAVVDVAYKDEQLPNGAYRGWVRIPDIDWDDELDVVSFDCLIPRTHIDELISLLSSNPNAPLLVKIDVLSYSCSRSDSGSADILVERNSIALISSINVHYPVPSKKIGLYSKVVKILSDDFKENKWPIIILLVGVFLYKYLFD